VEMLVHMKQKLLSTKENDNKDYCQILKVNI